MPQKNRTHFARYASLGVMFLLACVIFMTRLVSLQIAGQDYYTMSSSTGHTIRTEVIQALRGSIYDRNGNMLVTNEYSYHINLDGGAMPKTNAGKNALLLSAIADARAQGMGDTFIQPISPFYLYFEADGLRAVFNEEYFSVSYGTKLKKLLADMNLGDDPDPTESAAALLARYGITDKDGALLVSEDEARLLMSVRVDMEMKNFSPSEPYRLLTNVSVELIARLFEGGAKGLDVHTDTRRVYGYPGYASHIIGRTGKITSALLEHYAALGYPMNATVGVTGAEFAFEKYLHGTDGVMTVVEDAAGNIIDKYVSKEPVAGNDVYLTIDIDLQIEAEEALERNIQLIVDNANASDEVLVGEDASKGAIAAIDAKTGEVLALASNPTFNLATFNEDYPVISTDPDAPLYNRALEGLYEPGSTFKIGVAAAGLMEKVVTAEETIYDSGYYDYYEGSEYYPRCWLYTMTGGLMTHGDTNVTKAIEVSCNVYFYEVGRRLGIDKMNEYFTKFGLGQPTGIELTEKTGILAGPNYRLENSLTAWTPGDTLQAAIGQSDNVFTPLQISVYISTILSGGDRTNATILKSVNKFHTGEVIYETAPSVADSIDIPAATLYTIKNAMQKVTEEGTAAAMFDSFPIPFGAKTGTAEVGTGKSSNAIFTAFAPFNDPEIVVTTIIEQGSSGINAGYSVRDIFAKYFDIEIGG